MTDVSSDSAARGITVTIKYGKGFEETWAIFRGLPNEVRDDITSYFGIERESVAEMSLSEVVVTATSIAHGKGNIAKFLGGNVLNKGEQQNGPTGDDAWSQAESGKGDGDAKKDEPHWLVGAIEAASTTDALKDLYAENSADFKADEELLAAWKTRGTALQAA